jgi:hypothetical protein
LFAPDLARFLVAGCSMDCRIKSGNDLVPSLLRWSQKDAGAFAAMPSRDCHAPRKRGIRCGNS